MKNTMLYVAALLFVSIFSFLPESFASRKVTIPIESSLKLTNTSSESVTYNIVCKDKNGLEITTLTATGTTVAAGTVSEVTTSSSGGMCAAGKTENSVSGGASEQMKICAGTATTITNTSSIDAFCSASAHVCTLEEIASLKGASNQSYESAVFATPGSWSYYNGSSWTDYTDNSTHFAWAKFDHTINMQFSNGPGGTGTTTFNDSGWTSAIGTSAGAVFCCSPYAEIGQCEIEITSGGHLSTPVFNGGKPF